MKKLYSTVLTLTLALLLCSCGASKANITADTSAETAVDTVDTAAPTVDTAATAWDLHTVEEKLTAPNGRVFELNNFGYEILSYTDTRCLLLHSSNRELWLADSTTSSTNMFFLTNEQQMIDYTVAYDTIYWFTLDRNVIASDWQSINPAPYLFCKDALAVSPFADECEGAIVEPERANIDYGYGGLPIYSPYGIVD